jgi:TPR repeat protein
MPQELECVRYFDDHGVDLEPFLNNIETETDPELACSIALAYLEGKGTHINPLAAAKWLKRAAQLGSTFGAIKLGELLQYGLNDAAFGNSVYCDVSEAINWYRFAESIESGPSIQFLIAIAYLDGLRDRVSGLPWLKKAADSNHSMAQYRYSLYCHEAGNFEESFRYCSLAAMQNMPAAKYSLGLMYQSGEGCKQNDASAFNNFLEAANGDDTAAMVHVGWMYLVGKHVNKDIAKSDYWFMRSSEAGHPEGQYYHAMSLIRNDYGREIALEALALFSKSAEAGCPRSFVRLGLIYEQGIGVEKDISRAYAWYALASKHKTMPQKELQYSLDAAEEIGQSMSSDQKNRAAIIEKQLTASVKMSF